MKRLAIVAVLVTLFPFTTVADAAECTLSLDKSGTKLLDKVSEHDQSDARDGRWCGLWEGKYKSSMVFMFKDGEEVQYVYNVFLPRGRYDYDGTVGWQSTDAGDTKFDFGVGGKWRVYVTIVDGELHGVMKNGSTTESTVVMTKER